MRPVSIIFAGLAAVFLASCATYGDAAISGRRQDVTEADIRAAVAADLAMSQFIHGKKLREIEVVSRDEIRLYWGHSKREYPGHDVVKRVRGKWQFDGTIVVTS
jgi:hypothetical protein